ncbi:MAG: 5-oxoprolinase subunit PxpB [Acidimicrobiia bacterium]|nr:5-oxoprolinase subunit PxpB [Acidimicrobiia bacterium]
MRRRALRGVRDIVSTFHSVAVFFDPLTTDVDAVAAALHEAADGPARSGPYESTGVGAAFRRLIEVPVFYGGDAGPDLADVAAHGGLTPDAVIERHASKTYRVFMLGFLPGFAYMGSVDEAIAAPRRAAPRVRVPAGSVGIAGRQTGIYPRESPGGWQIIGRTPLLLFDPDRTPPAIFAPGDQVRFVPVAVPTDVGAGFGRLDAPGRLKAAPTTHRVVTVLRPGLFTTVQDSGRWGYQDQGVPVSGPMDPVSHRLANALVGNPRDAATLEATLLGPELRLEQETTVAIAGADLQASVDQTDLAPHAAIRCRAGAVLRLGPRRAGARAYVAFDGGIAVAPVLGSRATHVLSGLGGVDGRALKAGDRLPLGPGADLAASAYALQWVRHSLGDGGKVGPAGARLRVLPGPQSDLFDRGAFDLLQTTRFTISPQSDRMGYRLTSPRPIARPPGGEMISDVAFTGALQVPPSGDPILLMADRQTTGGYPQVAMVITADLPLAAQLVPGDWLEFALCTRAEAIAALVQQEGRLLAVR